MININNINRDSDQRLNGKRVPKGVALVIVLASILFVSIIAGVILILARGHYHATGSQIKHTKAYYLAEAGIQYALCGIRTGSITPPVTGLEHYVSTPGGNVKVEIDIAAHTGGLGVDWDITATVDTDDVPAK